MLSNEILHEQLEHCLMGTNFPQMGDKYEGKVRDNYTKNDIRVIITSDRLSAFDRIITLIPFKGQVLNQMAQFWFDQTGDIASNHMIDHPHPNVLVVKECAPIHVEMVVRGYITGVTTTSAWYNYDKGVRNFCGNELPEGLKKNQKFEKPIITPSTKAAKGDHDESVSKEEILKRGIVSEEDFDYMAEASLKLYQRGVDIAAKQGIILVDTKYEFGKTKDGEIVLIDEIHTPDSSRFWFIDEYQKCLDAGEEQKKVDKEYLREWLADQGFLGEGDVPEIPDEIRVETARRYIHAYEIITGNEFQAEVGNPIPKIEECLKKFM